MSIRVGRVHYQGNKQVVPQYDGYSPVVVLTKSSRYGSLGPYELRNDAGQIMENIWQFSKLYSSVPAVSVPYTRWNRKIVWSWPAEQHVDPLTQMPTPAYWNWRHHGMNNPDPVRYPVGMKHRNACLGAIHRTISSANSTAPPQLLDYVQARQAIYEPVYTDLVRRQRQYAELLDRLEHGEHLLICETDGPHQESLPYYQSQYPNVPHNFIENHTMLATEESLNLMLHDTQHAYGHGYCLARALLADMNV